MGGLGSGMICLEGRGGLSHVSLRHQMERFHEPLVFAALSFLGKPDLARIIEGPIPRHRIFGLEHGGLGYAGPTAGLPRFSHSEAHSRFPFGRLDLSDPEHPVRARIVGWSPFTPPDPDRSGLPAAALEYEFLNTGEEPLEAVFSFHSVNFLCQPNSAPVNEFYQGMRKTTHGVSRCEGGFTLWEDGGEVRPDRTAACRITALGDDVEVNPQWFRGGWFDSQTVVWEQASSGKTFDLPDFDDAGPPSPGGSLYKTLYLAPGESVKVSILFAWYTPFSKLRYGADAEDCETVTKAEQDEYEPGAPNGGSVHMMTERYPTRDKPGPQDCYRPWYASRFSDVSAVSDYWRAEYASLRNESLCFADAFHDTTLPQPIVEALSANLSILKSPTLLRQQDGRLWAWEGCRDDRGSCFGSCTHVWNYAHAIAHLFPSMERGLRETEFNEAQNKLGHQIYRISLPIRPGLHDFLAAADGQLGGVVKVYREWRISGDTDWLSRVWPEVRQSLEYCIMAWDPGRLGRIAEPHHVTYDIEFWGPESLTQSFYAAALMSAVTMGEALGEQVEEYRNLLNACLAVLENELFDGEYYKQTIEWRDALRRSPRDMVRIALAAPYWPEAEVLLESEGPKYQFGDGCLADGVIGDWMARTSGLGPVLPENRVLQHLKSVVRFNLRESLAKHANPQRAGYALGDDGGLLLCTWPHGGKPTIPFTYSNEVWTGIEYQVAAHLALLGEEDDALRIVQTLRKRYDGRTRNPFNEYECGHFYARALASWTLLQGFSGVRYDGLEKKLIVERSVVSERKVFLCTENGYGVVTVGPDGPKLDVRSGKIPLLD
ncbi:GH116 family glycosyl hydrolase [Parasphingorhabdus sp.]|uniref:GH116 family glycosyl hydrolase n=1 Tax=Parasphingorhabdus sp. TaxID=2709688 RepID=UPI0032ED935B